MKNNMKAISRLLIVALLFVGTTGFGLTTSDLSQDSKADIEICDSADSTLVSVVILDLENEVFNSVEFNRFYFSNENFNYLETKSKKLNCPNDVGWCFLSFENNLKLLKLQTKRNPRDGINYISE